MTPWNTIEKKLPKSGNFSILCGTAGFPTPMGHDPLQYLIKKALHCCKAFTCVGVAGLTVLILI
ncbi:MAG: hypothetical protein WD048_15140 [Chitinophagales bacterium]